MKYSIAQIKPYIQPQPVAAVGIICLRVWWVRRHSLLRPILYSEAM